jgi:hypothetical protein
MVNYKAINEMKDFETMNKAGSFTGVRNLNHAKLPVLGTQMQADPAVEQKLRQMTVENQELKQK